MSRPEVGESVVVSGRATNYLHAGSGAPVILIHGSGPGVSAYANWRLTVPALAEQFEVFAPDCLGFGYTERMTGDTYTRAAWLDHLFGFMDAVGVQRASIVGNSFGGALALAMALERPERIERLVLMGSVGVSFPITEALDRVWGYQPSVETMKSMLGLFAYDQDLVNDDLAQVRYEASIQPGFQESFAAMFPAPRQRWVDALASDPDRIRTVTHPTLVVHGRDDQVIPLEASLRLHHLIERSQLHVFGACGHWTQIEHAAAFNRLVASFLAD